MTRTRIPLALLLALTAGAAAAQQAPPQSLPAPVQGHEVTEVGPGYYTFRYTGTRNVFLITSAGVIVTDPIEPAAAALMRAEIRKRTDLPVKYVVYSHQHWDHVLGGQIFKDEGAKFIAHRNCVAHFTDMPHPDLVMPDISIDAAEHTLSLGDRSLMLRYLGLNHGDCLLVMTPDGTDVPFIVDLGTAGGMPLPIIPDYSLHNWIRSLRELEGWSFETYVGGHGIPVAPKSRLTERREYLEMLMQETKRELDAGTAIEQIPEVVAPRLAVRFSHLRGFSGIVKDNVRRVITYYGMGW